MTWRSGQRASEQGISDLSPTEVLPSARASLVSLFAGSLFVGSSLGAVLVAGLADQGRYAAIYLVGAILAIPLGLTASWGRWRWRRPAESA